MDLTLLAVGIAATAGLAVFALVVGLRVNSKKIVREQELDTLIDSIVKSEIEVERKENNIPAKRSWFGYWYNLSAGAGIVNENPKRTGYLALGIILVTIGIGTLGYPRDIVAGLLFAVGGIVALNLGLKFAATRRMQKLEKQLPNLLSGMRANLQANMTAQQALLTMINETPSPLGEELQSVRDDLELNIPLDTALGRLGQRVPSKELRFLVASMRIAIVSGADLNPLLKTIQEIVTQRTHIANKLAAAVAQAQPTIAVTAIMIPGGFVFSYFSDPANRVFWLSIPGLIALAVVAFLYAIALFISKKQVDKVKDA